MARTDRPGLDTPRSSRRRLPQVGMPPDTFGRVAEGIARYMGTPMFLVWMTLICAAWLAWNSMAPEDMQFDPRNLNFTLLTLILSLQASYAAPLLLLADNRSADRDRVEFEADRQRAERNLADTEFLAREVASLRIAMRDVATRDFIRSELRSLMEEMEEARAEERADGANGSDANSSDANSSGASSRDVSGAGQSSRDDDFGADDLGKEDVTDR
ncbi:DUF1003 domain-containing protein [Brevibacterium yomogidense]|uniref:PROBABLE MEMBRANE PROTEIN n=1 Tax=Brevibacterium yomogidense TaxID=946573 RepID=A0A1X6XM83_9MICO|nr:DUF1003 domain-containing protein [Brevibacterium yomogidense]SLN00109.1 PROBABLE MEMBRANE PROTEIN [Brevibacterium yomogidense]